MNLDKVVSFLKKKYNTVGLASSIPDPTDFVSTGNCAFDLILDGGIPFGYFAEFLGFSQSGKSLFIQQLIANAQKKYNAIGVLVDRENAYTAKRGEQLGIDNDNFILVKPSDVPTLTHAFQFILDTIQRIRQEEADSYVIIGLDSISAFGKDVLLEKADPGRKAKAAHEGLRELLTFTNPRTLFLIANQFTFKVGVMYGDKRTSTVGEAGKYYSNIRVALDGEREIKDPHANDEVVGSWIEAQVIKTRLGPCYRTVHLPHFYATGIDYYGGYARLLVDRGFLFPKNKQEFKTFAQKTVLYVDGDNKEQFSEYEVDKFLEKHPDLKFDIYPEFNKTGKKVVEEEEDE